MIRLTVNGKEEELPEQTPLPVYLESLGVTLPDRVAYNGEVVRREGHAEVVGRRHGDAPSWGALARERRHQGDRRSELDQRPDESEAASMVEAIMAGVGAAARAGADSPAKSKGVASGNAP